MWGGEGGARLKLCYFDRHLNYLIPSLLDNHQNFQDCWWQLSISCNEKENTAQKIDIIQAVRDKLTQKYQILASYRIRTRWV